MIHPDGPAFPVTIENGIAELSSIGLTKREYFAAVAMEGLLANEKIMEGMALASGKDTALVARGIALMAVAHAYGLIAELSKTEDAGK